MAEIFVCLDLGSDTLKISFAYEALGKESFGKLMLPDLINQVALPAAACYDEDSQRWYYADELEHVEHSHFSTVVEIKPLLSLFMRTYAHVVVENDKLHYSYGHYFPRFSFPAPRQSDRDFQYLIDQKLVFGAPHSTPQSVCEGFFRRVREVVQTCIGNLSAQTGISFDPLEKIALVHPPKQGERYVSELVRLVKGAFGVDPVKVLPSTQAIGLFALHRGLLDPHDRVLLFDLGDETVSVVKAWASAIGQNVDGGTDAGLGILTDSPEPHSPPLELGGSDIDRAIVAHLERCIRDRETVGSPSAGSAGHIYENGLCSAQYLLMKDIKKAKMLMPMAVTESGIFRDGVPISIHRETLVQRLLTVGDFYRCMGIYQKDGFANSVMEYVLQEMDRPINRNVNKILFAGGAIESLGLLAFLRTRLAVLYPHVRALTFETDRNDGDPILLQSYDISTYAAAVGGAIAVMKDYPVETALSYSYGTWLYHRSAKGGVKKHLKLFANRGDVLRDGENRFATETPVDVDRIELEYLDGDELFSTIIDEREMEEKKYSDQVTYDGKWLLVGEPGDSDRARARAAIDLRVVAGGIGSQIHFYYRGSRVAISSAIPKTLFFEEGFVVDKKGNARPFFSNLYEKNNTEIRVRLLRSGTVSLVNARELEFRLHMSNITVVTNT